MNRSCLSIACIVALLLAGAAYGVSTTSTTTSETTSTTASTGLGETLKTQLRSDLVQVLTAFIHELFQNTRTSLGLSDTTISSILDPLSAIETMIVDVVTVAATASSGS